MNRLHNTTGDVGSWAWKARQYDILRVRVAKLEALHPGEWELKGTLDAMREVDHLRARVAELEGLLCRALCCPLGNIEADIIADIINTLDLQPKG